MESCQTISFLLLDIQEYLDLEASLMSPLVAPQTPSSSEANSTPRSSVVTEGDPDNDSDSVFSSNGLTSESEPPKNCEADKQNTDVNVKGDEKKVTRVVNLGGSKAVFTRAPLQSEV